MYGTVARIRVRPENQQALEDILHRQQHEYGEGFHHAMVLFEDTGMQGWLIAAFDDQDSYERNARDPRQDARYREYRALLEGDPEWHDGHIRTFGAAFSATDLGLEDGSGFARGVKEEGAA